MEDTLICPHCEKPVTFTIEEAEVEDDGSFYDITNIKKGEPKE